MELTDSPSSVSLTIQVHRDWHLSTLRIGFGFHSSFTASTQLYIYLWIARESFDATEWCSRLHPILTMKSSTFSIKLRSYWKKGQRTDISPSQEKLSMQWRNKTHSVFISLSLSMVAVIQGQQWSKTVSVCLDSSKRQATITWPLLQGTFAIVLLSYCA